MPEASHRQVPGAHRFSHHAMATTFEVFAVHPDPRYAEQAAYAGFDLVDKLEHVLSRYIANSDASRISNHTTDEPLRIDAATFECLEIARRLNKKTSGAFDVTIGPLLACWRDENKKPRTPSEEELERAKRLVGMDRIELNRAERTVRLPRGRVSIDLGGIGKGYAVDRVAALLREWDVDCAVIHSGQSSVRALDPPPGAKGWPLTLDRLDRPAANPTLIHLANRSLAASGLKKGSHIIDPRTGRPVEGSRAVWVSAPTAADADALSTAFMIMDPAAIRSLCNRRPEIAAIIAIDNLEGKEARRLRFGDW